MRHRRALAAAVIPLLVLVACNDTRDPPSDAAASPVAQERKQSEAPLSIMYVQHAILGSSETDQDGLTLTLAGVDQITTWSSASSAGAFSTTEFVERWDEFGLDDDPPDAALVPAGTADGSVVVELSEPVWDEGQRVLTYQARVAADPTPRLADLVDEGAAVPALFGAMTLMIHQEEAPYVPSTPSTTTTTLAPATTEAPPTTSGTTAPPSPTTPLTGPAPTSPPSSTPPPTGPPVFVVEPSELVFPTVASLRTFTLRNIGSGLGSWSAEPQVGTGMNVTPSSGFLFPGSSVGISVAFNGTGPANDFATYIRVLATSGEIRVPIRVG
jgi:hypothetical protein